MVFTQRRKNSSTRDSKQRVKQLEKAFKVQSFADWKKENAPKDTEAAPFGEEHDVWYVVATNPQTTRS